MISKSFRSVNKVILLGELSSKPTDTYTGSGNLVCNMSLVTTESNRKKEEIGTQHNLVVYGNLAKICRDSLNEGSLVYVEGKTLKRKNEMNGGSREPRVEVIVNTIKFLDKKEGESEQQSFSESLGNS